MPFDTVSDTEKKTFEKIPFLTFDFGSHTIRILDDNPKKVYTHYLSSMKVVLKCLGEECPICLNNKKIIAEHPENYKDVPGYNFKNIRHYFNCLDRTEVKTCPECGNEVKKDLASKYPPVCSNGHIVTNAEPHLSNKVKVASISETNAVQIKTHEKSILDAEGNPVGMTNFDFLFMVTKVGSKKNITPLPMADRNDKLDVPAEFLHDLDRAVLTLSANEIVSLLQGVSLRDIFLARVGKTTETALDAKAVATNEDIAKKIGELYP
jgi:hypothetical protein